MHDLWLQKTRWAAVTFSLSPAQAGNAPEGRKLHKTFETGGREDAQLLMDKAYEDDETRQLIFDLERVPDVPPKSNRVTAWEYNEEIYKER